MYEIKNQHWIKIIAQSIELFTSGLQSYVNM